MHTHTQLSLDGGWTNHTAWHNIVVAEGHNKIIIADIYLFPALTKESCSDTYIPAHPLLYSYLVPSTNLEPLATTTSSCLLPMIDGLLLQP